ncbi:MAG: hypothetical protein OXD40_15450 [bacterium]|nr:hypothetical protein [bacterium]
MTRRTKAEMATIRDGLIALAKQHQPVTVRQTFYLAVSAGLIGKTEAEYRNTVCRLLSDARLSGDLSWQTIIDHTRSGVHLRTHDSLQDALANTKRYYRRAMWHNQPKRVEIWCEKATLQGVIDSVTLEWDVPLYPTRGYPSLSFLHSCAEEMDAEGKPTCIYYIGDHDPSGHDIRRNVEARLREFAPDVPLVFVPLAVTQRQIEEYDLPLRPTKQTDVRAKNWEGGSVEVEAIPPDVLRSLVNSAIEGHVDPREWEVIKVAEASERELLDVVSNAHWNLAERTRYSITVPI